MRRKACLRRNAIATVIVMIRKMTCRWFARVLDMMTVSVAWKLFLMLVCNVNLSQRDGLDSVPDSAMVLVLTIILEPVFLHCFGTTPGKRILGLYVSDSEDGRLATTAAREHTWGVLWNGCGLFGCFSTERAEMLQMIADNEFRSFTFSKSGVTIRYDAELVGYTNVGFLLPDEGQIHIIRCGFPFSEIMQTNGISKQRRA